MARPVAKFLFGFAIFAAVLVVVAVILTLGQPAPAPPPLPQPNGYDDFLKASGLLAGDFSNYPVMTADQLRSMLATNAEALRLVRAGLTRECRVPLTYSATNFQAHITDLAGMKRLAQLLAAEGRLAELEQRPSDAAESYLLTIRLGQASSRGGLIIHSLVGIAIQAIGAAPTEKLLPKLDAKSCRQFASALEAADPQQESFQTFVQRDRTWSRRTYGLKMEIYYYLITFKSARQSIQRFTARGTTMQSRIRHLSLSLASRAYELENGRPPKTPAELVPAYLKTIPLDPVTRTNMIY